MNFKEYYKFSTDVDSLCENASDGLKLILTTFKNKEPHNSELIKKVTNQDLTIEDISKVVQYIENNPMFYKMPPRIIGTFVYELDNKLKILSQKDPVHINTPEVENQEGISKELRSRIRKISQRYDPKFRSPDHMSLGL